MQASPQFQFWWIPLQLELTVLIYVRLIREGNFLVYVGTLSKIVPWFFALGHAYIHLSNMVTLATRHPSVYTQFLAGNPTGKKTHSCVFCNDHQPSSPAKNASFKGDGEAAGLKENSAALCGWMVMVHR